nr:tRNA pseudouridine(38-40) synthase [Kwoniella shandongensis]KAA5525606.1 tRNA pseudouridine(38-40) synthase [Kwoniella shandongensis]
MDASESSKRPRSPTPSSSVKPDPINSPPNKKVHLEPTASAPSAVSISDVKLEIPINPEEAVFNSGELVAGVNEPEQKGKGKDQSNSGKVGRGRRNQPDKRPQRVWEPRKKEEGAEDTEGDGTKRLPKKRCAVLLGYCGTGYSGMQIQTHGAKTIEGDLYVALAKAGAISADNATDHRKVDVQRAARTDAGVHAAGNAFSLKMIQEPPIPDEFKNLTEYVNSFLPDQIRMWGFVRTVKSFSARTAADSRIYEYLLPSYCLLPPAKDDPLSKRLDESSPGWRDALGPAAEFADAAPPMVQDEETGEAIEPRNRGEFERRRGWRVDEGTMKRFRDLIAQYKGTHNFHNYTVGKPFNDRTVKRYMIRLEVKDPQVYGEIEWISVQIHGQSFMLHQIRKMISMAMLACRTGSPPSLLPETFGPKRIHIPKAPPLGLLLEAPQFGVYNDRITQKLNGLTDDRDPVDFGLYAEQMHAFKVKWIYEKLRQEELEHHVFHKWMRQMDCSTSSGLAFLNTQGIIPPEADLSKRAVEARRAAKDGEEGKKDSVDDEVDSDDEEVDQDALRKGELEG